MAYTRFLQACGLALAASIAIPAAALAQTHPEFIPLGRVSAALYKPDSGPAPHIAFLVSHRTANNLNNIACKELAKRGFLALCWNTRFVNNEAAVRWEDIAFDVKLWAQDASLNTGVPLSKVTGTAHVSGETRAGHLAAFNGSFDAPALVIADRPATNFRADIAKRPESQAMTLYNMQAQVSGGALAGQVDWISP